ncbi:hypothetical protein MFRU_012g00360 [Monilinia fructicola]|uniref:Store-operated calcium entry-associated regulatory factor n=1 Tax=Monilinia fructicola TaxID=38448 RepID=A0A5M9JKI1_MONFR|nr:hypothetical protein EYC84_007500 [Monilinia fructicola]KAG4030293.1 hypothetical protein MFRU_012g00360 [Monilinia fructicola]
MLFLPFLYPFLLELLTFTPLTLAAKPKNAILLSKVKSLTLRDNAKTSHRRVSAVPQLSCSGPGCQYYKVDIMRCTNQGSDYSSEDIQWSCTANLPEEFKLGSTDVVCEGYDSKDDEYVLKGSCAVEYRLLLTEEGEEKYGKSFWDDGSRDSAVEKGMSLLFWLIFMGVLGWILYSMFQNWGQGPVNGRVRRGGGGGFGGWGPGGPGGPGDDTDPPPPYPGTGKRYATNYGAAEQAWRPGFWSGAAAGAAGAYLAGNRANRQQDQGSRNWGGGNWGGGSGSGWGPGSRSGSSSASSPSNSRSNTGFGSTSRR